MAKEIKAIIMREGEKPFKFFSERFLQGCSVMFGQGIDIVATRAWTKPAIEKVRDQQHGQISGYSWG